ETRSLILIVGAMATTHGGRVPASNSRLDEQYSEIKRYPHDSTASTQGLALVDGVLYEGTGEYGSSTIRRVELASGRVLAQVALDSAVYGEGIAVLGGRLYQLTWTSGVVYVYDPRSLKRLGSLPFEGAGWGLTHDGTHLIASDGTSELRFIDPASWRTVRRLSVRTQEGAPVPRL